MKGRFFVTALMTGASIILMSCAAPFHITDVEEANVELTIESMDEESHEGLENNGHFFVKVDDKIYFHVPSEENLDNASWLGLFAKNDYGNNVLMSYDLSKKEASKICEEDTFGNVFVMDGKLYTNCFEKVDGDMKVKAISFDLSKDYEEGSIRSDNICAVDKAGTTLVTSVYSDGGTNLSIHSNGKQRTVENVSECVACDGDKVFYITDPDYIGKDEKRFCEFDIAENKTTFLGYLPEDENGGDYYEFHQFTVDREQNKVYFSLNYYMGTTNELTGVYFISAALGEEESLTCEKTRTLNLNSHNGTDPTAFSVGSDGKMNSDVKGRPFYVTYDRLGHIIWYDENCEKHIVESKTDHGQVTNVSGELEEDPEVMEYIDGKIYIVRNILERAKEEDSGWRKFYKRKKVRIYSVDVNTGEETDIFELTRA